MKICTKCKIEKPNSNFGPLKAGRNGLSPICRYCKARIMRAYRQTPSGKIATKKQNRSINHKKANKRWTKNNSHKLRGYREKIRGLCFSAYGGYICVHCGEQDKDVLVLDHIDNNGAKHRKEIDAERKVGVLYSWIIKNKFPPIFQVLCHNCNWKKHILNIRKTSI